MTGRVREWARRALAAVGRGRSDADLDEELHAHLALADDAARHAAAPGAEAEAARSVRVRAGGVDQAMEALRDQRGVPALSDLTRDVREASRLFTRTPGVAAVAVVSLALSLALGLTVFRVLNAYLLRPLPYPDADRVHTVTFMTPGQPWPNGLAELPWESLDDIVEHRIGWDLDLYYILGGEYPEPVEGTWITPGFIDGLGLRVVHGRMLTAADFAVAGPTPVLISHRLWMTRFHGAADVLGRPIRAYANDRPEEEEALVVVGVMAPDFWHVNTYTSIVAPLRAPSIPYMVKLRPGVDARVASERVEALGRASLPQVPEGWRAEVASTQSRYVASITPLFTAVAAATGLVVLIACANVAVLLLARAVRRRHEMAVRLALGASRVRLARLLTTEAWLLAATAMAAALALSGVVTAATTTALEAQLGRRVPGGAGALASDPRLLAAAAVIVVLVTTVLALVPLLAASLPSLGTGLVSAGRGDTGGRTARRWRSALVAAELAGALALLSGAALMIDSTRRLLREDPGMRDDVLIAGVGLRQRAFPDAAERARFFARVIDEFQRKTGAPVAVSPYWPLQPGDPLTVSTGDSQRVTARAAVVSVSAGYFTTLGIPVLDGASFDADDRPGGAPVVVVSQSLANRLWPGARAVGQHLRVPSGNDDATDTPPARLHRVVGVAGDVRQLSATGPGLSADPDQLDAYLPFLQDAGRYGYVFAPEAAWGAWGADDRAVAMRRAVALVSANAAVTEVRTLGAVLGQARDRPRRLAWLLSTLALAATGLALVGVYGVLAYAVRQREREIGIRMAVGAAPADVTRLFMREGGRLIAAGLLVGLVGAVALGRTLEHQVFGVTTMQPRLLALAVVLLGACGTLALWWPARRAARVGPAQVLRSE